MILEAITKYSFIVENLNSIIDVSGYKNEYIASKLGMSPANFSAKKSRQSFSHQEIEQILRVINNEDVEDFFFLEVLRGKKNEESISLTEMKKIMEWK